jgi:hypothetical protein
MEVLQRNDYQCQAFPVFSDEIYENSIFKIEEATTNHEANTQRNDSPLKLTRPVKKISNFTTYQMKNEETALSLEPEKKNESPSKLSRLGKNILKSTKHSLLETCASTIEINYEDITDLNLYDKQIQVKVSALLKPSLKDKSGKLTETNSLLTISFTVDGYVYSKQFIQTALEEFNRKMEKDNYDYRFAWNDSFKLKPAKKNGLPKSDYPCIDLDSLVKDIGINNFSLIFKENCLVYVPKRRDSCCKCLIF